jgi:DNA-binding SARP family transcriptional activator
MTVLYDDGPPRDLPLPASRRLRAGEGDAGNKSAERPATQRRKVSYQWVYRKCGKERCRVCREGRGHGPYWYASWREGKRTRSRYIGRTLPSALRSTGSLSVRTLGGLHVALADGVVVRWTRRPRELFTLLLSTTTGRLHREVVVEALWPNLEPQVAYQNLRVTLSNLRKLLGAVVHMEGEQVVLTLPPGARDDVAFEAAAREALAGDDLASMRAALHRYSGEYLSEDRYSDWTAPRRRQLAELYSRLALKASQLALQQGAAEEVIDWLRPILADDHCQEAAVRLLMAAYAACKRRSDALRLYHQLVQELEQEFGVAPEPETHALYERIAQGYM